jgi:hypothetical protein
LKGLAGWDASGCFMIRLDPERATWGTVGHELGQITWRHVKPGRGVSDWSLDLIKARQRLKEVDPEAARAEARRRLKRETQAKHDMGEMEALWGAAERRGYWLKSVVESLPGQGIRGRPQSGQAHDSFRFHHRSCSRRGPERPTFLRAATTSPTGISRLPHAAGDRGQEEEPQARDNRPEALSHGRTRLAAPVTTRLPPRHHASPCGRRSPPFRRRSEKADRRHGWPSSRP